MNPFTWLKIYIEFLEIKRAREKFIENERIAAINDNNYGSFQVVDMIKFVGGNKKPIVTGTVRILSES